MGRRTPYTMPKRWTPTPNMAIGYALDTIDFSEAMAYKAEYAVIEELSAHAAADAVAT